MTKYVFILFQGLTMSNKDWNGNIITGEKSNLINELKKIGTVYTDMPSFYNIGYYYFDSKCKDKNKDPKMNKIKSYFNPDIDFTLNDLKIENYCKKVHDDVAKLGNKYILIGHSIGSFFVEKFASLYKKECLFGVLLDGTVVGKPAIEGYKQDMKFIKKDYDKLNITNKKLQMLIIKAREFNVPAMQNILDIVRYNLKKQCPVNITQFDVPILSIKYLDINDSFSKLNMSKIKEVDYFQTSMNKKYKNIFVVNKSHFLFYHKDVVTVIIDEINNYIKAEEFL